MILAIAATALCALLLLAGPDRGSPRAWITMAVMLATMIAGLHGGTVQLIAGAVALVTAPAIVVRAPRPSAAQTLHRAAALLATAACLLGSGSLGPSHHSTVGLEPALLVAYLVTALMAVRRTRRLVVLGEMGAMVAAMLAMVVLG